MSNGTQILSALRGSPLWRSPATLCACPHDSSIATGGLDLLWYFREFRAELGNSMCVDSCVAHYIQSAGPKYQSPNLAFDEFWYRQRYPEIDQAVRKQQYQSAWEHYLNEGAAAGYNPAFWFDEKWYRKQNVEVTLAIAEGALVCGFEHYLRTGVHTDALPSIYFNPPWYRRQYLAGSNSVSERIPLLDYLSKKRASRQCPVPFFDEPWYTAQYLSHTNTHKALPTYEHYVFVGRKLAHSPSPYFHEAAYRARFPEVVRQIEEGVYSTAFEHYAVEGVINGYIAPAHLGTGGLDYRGPALMKSYEKSFQLNLKQISHLRSLLKEDS